MIHSTENINKSLSDFLTSSSFDSVFILTDSNTIKSCLPLISDIHSYFNLISVAAGEKSKNIDSVQFIWKELIRQKATRQSLLINLGGGMISDLGGFCASTFQRGMDFIHIPTSLLGMVDASIGGKNGIDFLNYKNYVGTFKNPIATFVSPVFLNTLPKVELLNGWAEVIKHAIISENQLWNIVQNPIPDTVQTVIWKAIIEENIAVKNTITLADPIEKGNRKTLNFGHSIGHGLESFFLRQSIQVKHGFCVAAGIAMESYISWKMNLLSKENFDSIYEVIKSNFEFLSINKNQFPAILNFILSDKKNHSGKIFMALPKSIGQILFDIEVTENQILDALNFYSEHGNQPLR